MFKTYRLAFLNCLAVSIALVSCADLSNLSSNGQPQNFSEVPFLPETQPIAILEFEDGSYFSYLGPNGKVDNFKGKMLVKLHIGYVIVVHNAQTFVIPQERVLFIGNELPNPRNN